MGGRGGGRGGPGTGMGGDGVGGGAEGRGGMQKEERRERRIGLGKRLRDVCPTGLFRKPCADEVFALSLALLWVEGRPGGSRRRVLCRYALREGVSEHLLRYLDTQPALDDLWTLLRVWRKRAGQVLTVQKEYAPGLTVMTDEAVERLRELEQRLKLGDALRKALEVRGE